MNIMLVSVTERTREIRHPQGHRRAAQRHTDPVHHQAVVCGRGGVIGLGISYIGLQVIGTAMDIAMSLSLATVSVWRWISAFVGVFRHIPANKREPQAIDALRYE